MSEPHPRTELLNWSDLGVSELPTGTVTLLLADVEGSPRLWQTQPVEMTAALALLPITLPQGNYDEQMRARQLDEMRQDLMQAARRTETLHLFRQYVRELRERKQEERDAARRAKSDTTKVKADTVSGVP